MRKEGIIQFFNMYTGEILSDDNKKYIFRKDLDEEFEEGDRVSFEPMNYETPDINVDVAHLVKKKVYNNPRNR